MSKRLTRSEFLAEQYARIKSNFPIPYPTSYLNYSRNQIEERERRLRAMTEAQREQFLQGELAKHEAIRKRKIEQSARTRAQKRGSPIPVVDTPPPSVRMVDPNEPREGEIEGLAEEDFRLIQQAEERQQEEEYIARMQPEIAMVARMHQARRPTKPIRTIGAGAAAQPAPREKFFTRSVPRREMSYGDDFPYGSILPELEAAPVAYGGRTYQTGLGTRFSRAVPGGAATAPAYEEEVKNRIRQVELMRQREAYRKAPKQIKIEYGRNEAMDAIVNDYLADAKKKAKEAAEKSKARRDAKLPKANPYVYRYDERYGFVEKPLPKKPDPVNVVRKRVDGYGNVSWQELVGPALKAGESLVTLAEKWKRAPIVSYTAGVLQKAQRAANPVVRAGPRPKPVTYEERMAQISRARIETALSGKARIPAELRRADPRLSYLGGEYLRTTPTRKEREAAFGGVAMGEYYPGVGPVNLQ